jgi:hypothetical protein
VNDPVAAPPARRAGTTAYTFLAVACFTLLLVAQYRGCLIPGRSVPGDAGDSRLNMLLLEHTYQSLLGNERLLSPPIFYPLAGTGTFSDLHVGSVPAYAAARALGAAPFDAFQVWILCGLALNYLTTYLVAIRWRLRPAGANVAAAVFTFGLPMAAQGGHLQLLWRWPVPLATYWAWKEVAERSVFALVPAAGYISVAFLCSPAAAYITGHTLVVDGGLAI